LELNEARVKSSLVS